MIRKINSFLNLKNVSHAILIGIVGMITACNADPGACNCAKNSKNVLSDNFDKELFDKCDKYVKSLSQGEAIEYSKKIVGCAIK